ncbi:MAG: hypothetical protein LLG14_03330 [Nocardiaceae bacterium]|nr:hypothetical protein [Nocardiaceae bacterium]
MDRFRTSLLLFLVLFLAFWKPVSARAAGDEDPAGAAAIRALTSDDPVATQIAAVPADFGYRPAGTRYAVDPDGGCSSPIALPAVFDEPCKAHDLGYDVLRYAAAKGHPLGSWARDLLDRTLERRLHAACDSVDALAHVTCTGAAWVAAGAVRVNSWRQHSGVPVPETGAEIVESVARSVVQR